MKTLARITFNPAAMSGKPCLRGLRVTGGTMVGLVAAEHSHQEGKEREPMGSASLWRSPRACRLVLALLLAAATPARANSPLTTIVHPGARQTFQGFGASFVESPGPYGRISQADRDALARLVWHDCRFRILRLWFSPPAFAPHPGERNTTEFLRDYVTSGMTADAQRAGATTLLLAPNQVPAYLGKGDVITSQGITDYASLLADFLRKVKDENGITFAASGVLNEPHDGHPIIQANQWAEMVRAFRKALDERGLQSVAIIAPEHASGGDAYCMQSLESIHRDPEAWRALGGAASHSYNMGVTERMAALVGDKPFWMTEASANGPEEPDDALAGASLAARVLNDLNHRATHWIHFIAYHLADPADDQTRMIRYWTPPFRYEILQKYWYYQQLSQTFDVGAVFRHSTSSLGDPEMTWTYGKKPKLIAAAARNADGTWAVGLANFTHASFTDRRDNDDQHGFPAETFDVTVVIDELRAAGDLIMQVNRSNHGINNRPAGAVILTQGRVTLRDVAPCDLITLRASRSRGVEESRNSSTNPAVAVPAMALQPFSVEWPAEGQFPADISFLLQAPAGKAGFIRTKDGHLVLPGGARFRIRGLNATMQAGLPSKAHAPVVAANLARRGVNCVRFHFLDRLAPVGLIAADRNDTRALDAQQLDWLDFFIAELKQRGIYADLNLNVGRTYKADDGVRDFEWLGFPKGLTYFDERLIELQKEYAAQLLGHVNPYTGNAYRDEPAVALVEFVNENSLVEAWFSDRLLGQQTNRPAGTWHDIPPSYAAALTAQYNAWLNRRLPAESLARLRAEAGVGASEPMPRLRRDQFEKASNERFQAEAGFYMDVEREFFAMMSRYLREELGVKSLLIGNSDHNHGRSGYPIVAGASLLDVIDGHVYWQHPNYRTDPKTGRQTGFDIPNTPMVDDPLHSTAVQLSRSAVAGKPYTVSEVNHPFPNEYACEGVPILAAYAAFQDWDGIFWYTLAHKDVLGLEPVVAGHFDFAEDPVKMSQLTAGALLFLRGDARPAARTVARSYTAEQVRESIRLPWADQPYFTPGFPLTLPLQHAMRVSSFEGPPTGSFEATAAGPIQSDTGELAWQCAGRASGLVVVNTPRSQALIGYCGGRRPATDNLEAGVNVAFCAITANSLDGKPIADAGRLLVTATARVANTGMEWNDRRTSLAVWGKAPTCIEPVTGELVLKNLRRARSVSLQPLDGAGRPLGGSIPARQSSQGWTFRLGEPATTWFVVTLGR